MTKIWMLLSFGVFAVALLIQAEGDSSTSQTTGAIGNSSSSVSVGAVTTVKSITTNPGKDSNLSTPTNTTGRGGSLSSSSILLLPLTISTSLLYLSC